MGRYSKELFKQSRPLRRSVVAPTIRQFAGETGKPDPKLKGVYGGNCNLTRCQAPGAYAWSMNNRAYYCDKCAAMLNTDPVNRAYWRDYAGVSRFVFRIDTLTPGEIEKWKAKNGSIPGIT
jgi:hypothetical protein